MYQHEKLVKENAIVIAELPSDLQNAIAKFDAFEQEYDLEVDVNGSQSAKAISIHEKMEKLSEKLAALIEEELEDEAGEHESEEEKQEAIIDALFQKGKKEISLLELKKSGFLFEKLVRNKKVVVGKYIVSKKSFGLDVYQLELK